MMRREAFTSEEIRQVQAFALRIGLRFARDMRPVQGLRRSCIHEAGHAVMYAGFQVHGWRIEIDALGSIISMPTAAVPVEQHVIMSLGGPLAEEWLCGPRGVFLGAIDDLWQVMEARRVIDGDGFNTLVAYTRQVLKERKQLVLQFADVLQENGSLSEADLDACDSAGAARAICLSSEE
jgi:hypothetical protein